MAGYNLLFEVIYRGRKRLPTVRRSARLLIVLQISFDLISLTLLLYFAGLPFNQIRMLRLKCRPEKLD
jgi:hypothetical protein